MADKISVIVPIYKGEQWLPRCIESLQSQTFQNLEIILVNDGSPDHSDVVCKRYAEKDHRILYVEKENGGLSDARNAGLDVATGEYIAFLDEDDYIHPKTLEFAYQVACNTESDIVFYGFQEVDDGEEISFPAIEKIETPLIFEGEEIMEQLYYRNLMTVVAWDKLYKRSVFANHRYIKGRIHDDESAIHFFLHECQRTAYIQEKLHYYVQRGGSITGHRNWQYYEDAWVDYLERIDFLKQNDYHRIIAWTKQQVLHLTVKCFDEIKDSAPKEVLEKMQKTFHEYCMENAVMEDISKKLEKEYKTFDKNPQRYYERKRKEAKKTEQYEKLRKLAKRIIKR